MGGKNTKEKTPEVEIDLTPDQIQQLMESKANLEDQVADLKIQNNNLQKQLNIYQQNAYNIQ